MNKEIGELSSFLFIFFSGGCRGVKRGSYPTAMRLVISKKGLADLIRDSWTRNPDVLCNLMLYNGGNIYYL